MVAQPVLPFQYQRDSNGEATALGGLPLYFELAVVAGVVRSIARYLRVRQAGWDDVATVVALLLLNLAGGTRVEDLERLEQDAGLRRIMLQARLSYLPRRKRRRVQRRWACAQRAGKTRRAFPSASSVFRYLERFHDPDTEALREQAAAAGRRAFIAPETEAQRALWKVVRDQLEFFGGHEQATTATLDMDAVAVPTSKREAKFCYKGFRAYHPLNVYWYELDAIVYSEFRDGNVPPGFGLLPVFQRALDQLPPCVDRVVLRSDTAGYTWPLLHYCAEGRNERFGRIDFAVGADVTPELKREVAKLSDKDWHTLEHEDDGDRIETGQQWAELAYVPNEAARTKDGPTYRFLVTREPLESELPGLESDSQPELPFPTMDISDSAGHKTRYKLYAVVTTLDSEQWQGDEVIWWLRGRCGRSEQAHDVMKRDLAGGTFPSGLIGANAAWWAIMLIAFNLNTMMKRMVLGRTWVRRRMKALRFHLVNVAGRVVHHARQLSMRVAAPALERLEEARARIHALANAPPG